MARPKKTLFGFTRKRIFDSLLIRFTGFTVSQNACPGNVLTFRYCGNINIEIEDTPDRDGLILTLYTSGKAGLDKPKELKWFDNRSDINAWIAETFAGYDFHARRGLFGEQAKRDANYRHRQSTRREVQNES